MHGSEISSPTVTNGNVKDCTECNLLRVGQKNRMEVCSNQLLTDPEEMSVQEMFEYLQWTNSSSCRMAVDFGFALLGESANSLPDGHKAVCLDQNIRPAYNNCLVYSFGINNQWTFDEAMANFKCQVFSFDPSMGSQDHNRSDLIHFFNLGLAKEDALEYTTYDGRTKDWKVMKASSIYNMLKSWHGERAIDVFKMDIELGEWPVLREMLESGFLASKIKQLAVEIHLVDELDTLQDQLRLLMKLESPLEERKSEDDRIGGFARFSSRLNPFTPRRFRVLQGKEEFEAYELAWYNTRFLR